MADGICKGGMKAKKSSHISHNLPRVASNEPLSSLHMNTPSNRAGQVRWCLGPCVPYLDACSVSSHCYKRISYCVSSAVYSTRLRQVPGNCVRPLISIETLGNSHRISSYPLRRFQVLPQQNNAGSGWELASCIKPYIPL